MRPTPCLRTHVKKDVDCGMEESSRPEVRGCKPHEEVRKVTRRDTTPTKASGNGVTMATCVQPARWN